MSLADALEFVEFHEGGWVDDPDDSGGETIYGISRRAHPDPEFWKDPTPEKARRIYERHYWTPSRLYLIPSHIAVVAFDMLVNHGHRDAVKALQRASGAVSDGILGPGTRKALKTASIPRIIQYRLALYDKIVERSPKNAKFLDGWRWRSACLAAYATGIMAGIPIKPNGGLE